MPQFELENVGPNLFSGFVRGRSAEEAVRSVAAISDKESLLVGSESDVQGWQTVLIKEKESGRVRVHQRMRFRRD